MKRLPLNLREKQHEALRQIAFEDKKSMSDVARTAIDEYIKKRNAAKNKHTEDKT